MGFVCVMLSAAYVASGYDDSFTLRITANLCFWQFAVLQQKNAVLLKDICNTVDRTAKIQTKAFLVCARKPKTQFN